MTEVHDHPGPEADAVKSVGEEAWLLLKALSVPAAEKVTDDVPPGDHDVPGGCPNNWCPVCSAVAFVRQNPAAVRHVTSSAASWLRLLADAIDQHGQSDAEPASDAGHAQGGSERDR